MKSSQLNVIFHHMLTGSIRIAIYAHVLGKNGQNCLLNLLKNHHVSQEIEVGETDDDSVRLRRDERRQ